MASNIPAVPSFAEVLSTLLPDPVPVTNPGEMPDAVYFETPQPGDYRMKLPEDMQASGIWEAVQTANGQRLRMNLRGRNSIQIIGGPKFSTSLRNEERKIKDQMVNDLAFLAKALGITTVFKSNQDYLNAFKDCGGREFDAGIDLSTNCRPTEDIRGADGKPLPGRKGCGRKYGTRAYKTRDGKETFEIPRNADQSFATEFECQCGAVLRCFPNLRFR